MTVMRALCLLSFIVCAACAKKPAPKTPAPPAAEETKQPEPDADKEAPVQKAAPSDPCEGGE